MSYRLSNDPDPPVLRDAWEYLEACGVPHDCRGQSFADFELADLFFRLIGPDPERVRGALRLQELVERAIQTDGEIGFDLPVTGRYQVHVGVRDETPNGATLAEAVEAALEELGDG